MKHVVKDYYICERCGISFTSKAEAENCESSHLTPYLISQKYQRCSSGYPKYPVYVDMQFVNGKTLRYIIDMESLRE